MCHTIDIAAKRPRARYAYKAVNILWRGKYCSPHADLYVPGTPVYWEVGQVVRAVGLGRSKGRDAQNLYSTAGIYVYRRLRDAKCNATSYLRAVIRVEVDPKDWLTTSTCGVFATYRKAKMVAVVKK